MRRKWLAGARVEPDGMVEEELWEAARCEPWHAAVDSRTPESESPITGEPVPAKKCRLHHGTGHRLDGIPRNLANMPELLHHKVTIHDSAASRPTDRVLSCRPPVTLPWVDRG